MRPTTEPRNISQGFSAGHKAVDWSMGIGGGLQAVMDGTVVDYTRADGAEVNRPLRGHMTNRQNWHPGRGGIDDIGNCLVLRHANNVYSVYLHVSPYNVSNLRGRSFKKGDRLPVTSGHNGWSTGPHLHFEVFVNGTRRNPLPWLDNITPPTSGGGSNVSKTTLTTARRLIYSVLGRNGITSKTNASTGGADADLNKHHVGVELTPTYIGTLWRSDEAKRFRSNLQALKNNHDHLERENEQLTKKVKDSESIIAGLEKSLSGKDGSIETVRENYDEAQRLLGDERLKLKETNRALELVKKRNEYLEATVGASELTDLEHLKVGFSKLITRMKQWLKNSNK